MEFCRLEFPPNRSGWNPNFGRHLKKKMDELGLENVFVYMPDAKGCDAPAEMQEFFQKPFAKVN